MKPLIAVPVYNGEPMVHQVVQKILQVTEWPLLVIDDGSHPVLKLEKHPRLTLIRVSENQGKGLTLQKALHWAQEHEFTHLVTIDGDGQHLPEDLPVLLEECKKHPKDFVIGAREFNESVPGVSRFGRKFSNFWVWYQTGVKVSDSQSGLRVYPVRSLAPLKYFTKRYDFEIEVLVRGIWRGLKVHDVKVGVKYAPEGERVSHFHKFWDNVRITLLNIFLIAYSLLFYQRSLFKVVLAGVLGFMSTLIPNPLAGVFLGVLACIFLKVNVIVFLLAFLALLIF